MSKRKLLITGAAGDIGTILFNNLPTDQYDLVLADLREPTYDHDHPFIQMDISDLDQFTTACEGVDTVVHMAADRRTTAPWETLLPANVIGVYNAFEAAHRAGCRRIIYASSVNANNGHARDVQLRIDTLPHPGNLYGATKVWGEMVGKVYSDRHDLSVICLRIGWLTRRDNKERFFNPVALHQILTHEDAYRLIQASIEAPDSVKYGVFNGVSDNRFKWQDISSAREILGYAPQDDSFALKEEYEKERKY